MRDWRIDVWACHMSEAQLRAVYTEASRWLYDSEDAELEDMPVIRDAMIDRMEYNPDDPDSGPDLDELCHTVMWEIATRWAMKHDSEVEQ